MKGIVAGWCTGGTKFGWVHEPESYAEGLDLCEMRKHFRFFNRQATLYMGASGRKLVASHVGWTASHRGQKQRHLPSKCPSNLTRGSEQWTRILPVGMEEEVS